MTVSTATLDAAVKAAMDGVLSQHGLKLTEDQVWPIVWIALTDAAPHIAAAERERIRQLDVECCLDVGRCERQNVPIHLLTDPEETP